VTYVPIGVRDCFVASPGWSIYSVDFVGGELVTFAESAVARVGYSKLGAALNKGLDVHSDIGAEILGITYDDFYRQLKKEKSKRHKDVRQAVKPVIFGVGGMIGPLKIVLQQRKQGPDTEWPDGPSDLGGGKRGFKGLRFCLLMNKSSWCGERKVTQWGRDQWIQDCPPTCVACIEAATQIRQNVFGKYTEYKPYLKWHSDNLARRDNEFGQVTQHYSLRVRGGLHGPDAANGDFQALLADIAKRAHIRVTFEQYTGCLTAQAPRKSSEFYIIIPGRSVLWGSRGQTFAHDELLGETPRSIEHEVAMRVKEIMEEEYRRGSPNHEPACKAEEALMLRWYKAAERVVHRGRVVPWTPEHDVRTCAECAV
jgi:hypothetical protein